MYVNWFEHVCLWYQLLLLKLLEKYNEIIDRKTELGHHRPRTKAHSNEYENNTHKAEQALWSRCCPAATVQIAVVFACQETCGPHGRAYEFRQDRQPWKIIHDEG